MLESLDVIERISECVCERLLLHLIPALVPVESSQIKQCSKCTSGKCIDSLTISNVSFTSTFKLSVTQTLASSCCCGVCLAVRDF